MGEVRAILRPSAGLGDAVARIYDLPFYRALAFTLAYTAWSRPWRWRSGSRSRSPSTSLPPAAQGAGDLLHPLPMIMPPLVGALILFWMIDPRGIIGAIQNGRPATRPSRCKASAPLAWATLIAHGIWTSAPFVFIIFYAALQTVPRDTLEAAMIDGASRLERLRLVVLPHLKPLATFLMLVLIMDNFRVFESIIGLSASAHASSLSTLVFFALAGDRRSSARRPRPRAHHPLHRRPAAALAAAVLGDLRGQA